MKPANLDAICIARLKSRDFAFPKSRKSKERLGLIGSLLFALLILTYIIVGG